MSEVETSDLKIIIGAMGLDILKAVARGGKIIQSIVIISGCSEVCVKGRTPILINTSLLQEENGKYFITEQGEKFLKTCF